MKAADSRRGGKLRVERFYPQAPAVVWRALTDAELLGRWLMPNDFRPELGHRFTLTTEPGPGFDGRVHCEVLALEPGRRMTWSWRGGPLDTVVSFDLTPDAGGTRLRVNHTGFRGAKGRLVQWILGIGNRTLYGRRLPALLAELDGAAAARVEGTAACMSLWQRVLIAITGWLPARRRDGIPPAPPTPRT